jgi:hypothetical protein
MPFGVKLGPNRQPIDFNRVYQEYIVPALDIAGLEAFRADEEIRAGDIRTDMFQELLVADLVIADLTIDNPNVWYELGCATRCARVAWYSSALNECRRPSTSTPTARCGTGSRTAYLIRQLSTMINASSLRW